jgi:hypothetical protein
MLEPQMLFSTVNCGVIQYSELLIVCGAFNSSVTEFFYSNGCILELICRLLRDVLQLLGQ